MKTKLVINGLDFLPFIAQGGIAWSKVARNQRSVVVLSGKEFRTENVFYSASVTCLNLTDEALRMILSALSTSPVTVTYSNRYTSTERTTQFYVDDISFTDEETFETFTNMSGISFTITEVGG